MEIGWNWNTMLSAGASLICATGVILILRINWKQYGTLLLLSSFFGVVLCTIFLALGYYTFPFRLFPSVSKLPFTLVLTMFPLYVMAGVRYSPKAWSWKIPFYWVIVHIGVASEAIMERTTDVIKYGTHWGLWDSYIWWWLFLLVFECIGGIIVKPENRKPLNEEYLKHGKIGWFLTHFILIASIFMAGVYTGILLFG